MTAADSYRQIAAELRARALKAHSDEEAVSLDNLARCYIRLAEQADENATLDVSAEFGGKRPVEGDGA